MSLTLPYYKFVNNWENAFREYKQGLVSKEIEWTDKNSKRNKKWERWMNDIIRLFIRLNS